MATQALLTKGVIRILASPLIALSYAMALLKVREFRDDLQRCLAVIDTAPFLPDRFVTTLVAAEDHRSAFHPGVDPIAILRVMIVWVRTGKIQGASTIEQQLVRVVLGRYERTIRRKYWEQILAIALSSLRPKDAIAKAYLSIAFYGTGQYGVSALMRCCGSELRGATQINVMQMVARLKYPEPLSPSPEWHQTIQRRVRYIEGRLRGSANSRLHVPRMIQRAP
ncbi:MAG: Monofunctional biosynthetic peptidoglycan transglycosylase [Rhodocyclaceae bacterium]|nr:Monofunctional biosynthetic peptidoglycan transglycosylase [Rhodocyclaceae bacterium]